jgi:hypothetical protein
MGQHRQVSCYVCLLRLRQHTMCVLKRVAPVTLVSWAGVVPTGCRGALIMPCTLHLVWRRVSAVGLACACKELHVER